MPEHSVSGGKILHRATDTLRLCAQSLTYSKSALGAKYRRLKARLGAPKAIVAMARHLARLVYRMLRHGQNYVEQGIHHYELKFRLQRIKQKSRHRRLLCCRMTRYYGCCPITDKPLFWTGVDQALT